MATRTEKRRGISIALGHIAVKFVRTLRDSALKALLCSDFENLQLGRFRSSGEVHQCMYDRHSLKTQLEHAGFLHIGIYNAFESGIKDWPHYCLDIEADGRAYKPDSIYMEGIKPLTAQDRYQYQNT